jgi:ribA/ribD-fused uncharacterized protein
MPKRILFYSHRPEKYSEFPKGNLAWAFSNFSAHPVEAYGMKWKTSEHLYQALKFLPHDYDYAMKIHYSKSPMQAKILGNSREHPLRQDWEEVKNDIMYYCVLAKILQHPEIEEYLLSTGSSELIEDSPTDYYWGIGRKGTGKNMLGVTLMKIRERLREE